MTNTNDNINLPFDSDYSKRLKHYKGVQKVKTTVVVNSEPLNSDVSQFSSTSRQNHKVVSQADLSRHCPNGPIVHWPTKIDFLLESTSPKPYFVLLGQKNYFCLK